MVIGRAQGRHVPACLCERPTICERLGDSVVSGSCHARLGVSQGEFGPRTLTVGCGLDFGPTRGLYHRDMHVYEYRNAMSRNESAL